jgi:hypothetical protein
MILRPSWLLDDPSRWRAGTLDREALRAETAALARRAGFHQRAQAFAHHWLQTQAEHPALRTVFRNTPRYMLLVTTLVLAHRAAAGLGRGAGPGGSGPRDTRPASGGPAGITPGQLADFFATQLPGALRAGPSQLKAMLAHARLQGLLMPAPGGADGRQRPLLPTPLLQRILCQWVAGFLHAAEGDPAFPLPATPARMVAVPGLVADVFSYRLAAVTEDRFVLFESLPALGWVLRHDHGYRCFLHMVQAGVMQADGTLRVPLSTAELARRAGAARGTVRQLLADAAAQGWLHAEAPALGWRWTAAATRTALHWIALELTWMHALACAAWADSGQGRH